MKRKKPSPDESRAWREARDARIKALYARAAKIEAELAAKRKPA
jgi:hypothetical protein